MRARPTTDLPLTAKRTRRTGLPREDGASPSLPRNCDRGRRPQKATGAPLLWEGAGEANDPGARRPSRQVSVPSLAGAGEPTTSCQVAAFECGGLVVFWVSAFEVKG
jgi:hypothetical protein